MLIAALFTRVQMWKQPKCPSTDEWIKMWYVYSNGILLSHKKERSSTISGNMNMTKIITLSEVRQKKTNIWYHSYAESISLNDINELICKLETDLQISNQM